MSVQRALNTSVAGEQGKGAPQRGDGAGLEALAELVDALGGVRAFSHAVHAAEPVAVETARRGAGKVQKCQGALTNGHREAGAGALWQVLART